jgi:ATP-dependent RNA helicase DeaD
MLVFARTRVDVAEIASELDLAGFAVSSLSGDMEQPERNRALSAFKRGTLRVLVATDVAARGIDVQDIARVVHAEPPTDADAYTHRSGRTGRAGRKGTSSVLVAPSALPRVMALLKRAKVRARVEPLPTADDIHRAAEMRSYAELVGDPDEDTAAFDDRTWALAQKLADSGNPARVIARLLVRARYGKAAEPRAVHADASPAIVTERKPAANEPTWVPFYVSFGSDQGADPRRLLAIVCRRGAIRGSDVGAIRIGRSSSSVDIASHVADAYAVAAKKPDPRNPRVFIRKESVRASESGEPVARDLERTRKLSAALTSAPRTMPPPNKRGFGKGGRTGRKRKGERARQRSR